MVTETKALANSLAAPSGAEREEIILIIPDKWETRQGMKCARGKSPVEGYGGGPMPHEGPRGLSLRLS